MGDPRIVRLIQKWLKAGVSEEGQRLETKVGTPQGAVISPLLANIYLHYVFDLWVEVWRRKVTRTDVIVVRYADDLVVGFESRKMAEQFLGEFRERLAKFGVPKLTSVCICYPLLFRAATRASRSISRVIVSPSVCHPATVSAC